MSGPTSSIVPPGGIRNDEPARLGRGCWGNARMTAADCERCIDGRPPVAEPEFDGPATIAALACAIVRDVDAPLPTRARAACASACASSALRYRCAGVSVAAGDVELGVSVMGESAAADGGVTGDRAIDMERETADGGSCIEAGEGMIDEFRIITWDDVK